MEASEVISREALADIVSNKWDTWKNQRAGWEEERQEIRNYIFATDTSNTTGDSTPWKNRTHIPKICHIRDNLHANYMASLFPNDDWVRWEGHSKEDDDEDKKKAIQAYMSNKIRLSEYIETSSRLLLDYIDSGIAICDVIWVDDKKTTKDGEIIQGYVGPRLLRISPNDIVFDPTAINFSSAPKITRTITRVGDLKLKAQSEGGEWLDEAVAKAVDTRNRIGTTRKDDFNKANAYSIDKFGNLFEYYSSGFVEVLEFEGTMHSPDGTMLDDYVITIIDRAHVVRKEPIPAWKRGGFKAMTSWRKRPDNLIGMGPLDNLIGLQYRLDHLENAKADAWDLIITPMFKIKGDVDEFEFRPGGEVHMSEDGDIEPLTKPTEALAVNNEISYIMQLMEEMAGAPKQMMGVRTPGEKTLGEVNQLENAASRIFQEKISQFERELLEPSLNSYLELSVQKMNGVDIVRVMDDDFGVADFQSIKKEDITAKGKVRPIGSRHFAHRAQLIQNLTGIANSPIWQKVEGHFSNKQLAKLVEDNLQLTRFDLFADNAGLVESAESANMAGQLQQSNELDAMTDIEDESEVV